MYDLFCEVLLPLPLPKTFTYRIPADWADVVQPLLRVIVRFQKSKLYTGIIVSIHKNAPLTYQANYLEAILETTPIITAQQLVLWEWISNYYWCTLGEVMEHALLSSLKLHGEKQVSLLGSYSKDDSYTITQQSILEVVEEKGSISLKELIQLVPVPTTYQAIKQLSDTGILEIVEQVQDKYKPIWEDYVYIPEEIAANLAPVFEKVKRYPKQEQLLLCYLQLSIKIIDKRLKKKDLLTAVTDSESSIKTLVKNNILCIEKRQKNRIPHYTKELQDLPTLSTIQQEAYESIKNYFEKSKTVLLHGITGSGKTAIYIQLMQETIQAGKQVLYLLPEIALSMQLITKLQAFFGNKIQVYHSGYNTASRTEIWYKVAQKEEINIILGTRSALFLPYTNIGLVIIDEEHEASYKSNDYAPRYHARDIGIVLGTQHKANILLGSATPSIESYYNALENKYGLVTIKERFGEAVLPTIHIIDIKKAHKEKTMRQDCSPELLAALTTTLKNNKQSILFQNRRGFAPILECLTCGHTPSCKHCDTTLTYHKYIPALKCHICGYQIYPTPACQECGSTEMKLKGFGTEKIMEDMQLIFPQSKVARLDLETTRTKQAYQDILNAVENREIDILVGTQMVTKGLDFEHVTNVGILNLDSLLHYPDFRAMERAFQLAVQVAGRAGRTKEVGNVWIQTYQPTAPILQYIQQQDFIGFYNYEIEQRKIYQYAPFYKLIEITLKHIDSSVVRKSAQELVNLLQPISLFSTLGPSTPAVGRVRNLYLQTIILKYTKTTNREILKHELQESIRIIRQQNAYKGISIQIQVDV